MFDSLEIIKENSHEEVSLKLHELIAEFLKDKTGVYQMKDLIKF